MTEDEIFDRLADTKRRVRARDLQRVGLFLNMTRKATGMRHLLRGNGLSHVTSGDTFWVATFVVRSRRNGGGTGILCSVLLCSSCAGRLIFLIRYFSRRILRILTTLAGWFKFFRLLALLIGFPCLEVKLKNGLRWGLALLCFFSPWRRFVVAAFGVW
ncbi:MAG: hypothetical protein JWN25_97 [Verrucomicrobiales bacterium]|nr:hypothetical protein [Verrucomicrobiales bacterium]